MRRFIIGVFLALLLLTGMVLAGLFLLEKSEHREVARELGRLKGVQIIAVRGDYDGGITADVSAPDGRRVTIGTIYDSSFASAGKLVYVEAVDQVAVWRVGCHPATPGLPQKHRFWAIRGDDVRPGTFIGSRLEQPIRSVFEAISKNATLMEGLARLPACASWTAKAHNTPVCQAPVQFTSDDIHQLLRDKACD